MAGEALIVVALYVMDASGGQKRVWAGALNDSPGEVTWTADSSGVYFTVDEKGSTSIYYAPLAGAAASAGAGKPAGAPRKVSDGVHMLAGLSVADNGQAAVVRVAFNWAFQNFAANGLRGALHQSARQHRTRWNTRSARRCITSRR